MHENHTGKIMRTPIVITIILCTLGCSKKEKSTDKKSTTNSKSQPQSAAPLTLTILEKGYPVTKNRGFENSYDFNKNHAVKAAYEAFYEKFVRKAKIFFKNDTVIKYWKRGHSFGVLFHKNLWGENIRCNLHTKDKMGPEAVPHTLILRDEKLGIDYRFYFAPKDITKKKRFDTFVRSLAH